MRPFLPALAIGLAATFHPGVAAWAQTAVAPGGPATPAPASPSAPAPRPQRITFGERFDAANTTRDGKLTRAQADAAGMAYVVRHFAAIDRDGKGYVTKRDVRDYFRAQRAQHANPQAAPPTQ